MSLTFTVRPPPTAFSATARLLRRQLREARVDHDAFETPLRPCDLANCRATCCHDGAVLSDEEADLIRNQLESRPEAFAGSSVLDPAHAMVRRNDTLQTATRPAAPGEWATDFPAHFARTRCVFLDRDHKCTLQRLSTADGQHPWFFKPLSCWMHPIRLDPTTQRDGRPLLTLLTPARDNRRFASCTPCGRPDPDGALARDVLHAELVALSQIADRDFLAELGAPSATLSSDDAQMHL